MTSSAAAVVQFDNKCPVDFYRQHHRISHNNWDQSPPETLRAGCPAQASFSRRNTEYSAVVNYAVICRSVEYVLSVFIFSKAASGIVSIQHTLMEGVFADDKSQQQQPGTPPAAALPADSLFQCVSGVSERPAGGVSFVQIWTTPLGGRYFEECRAELFMKFHRTLGEWERALNDLCLNQQAAAEVYKTRRWRKRARERVESVSDVAVTTDVNEESGKEEGGISSFPSPDDSDWDGVASTDPESDTEERQSFAPPKAVDAVSAGLDSSARLCESLLKIPAFSLRRLLVNALKNALPRSFLLNVQNTDWQTRLRASKLSLFVKIVNNTSYYLHLDTSRPLRETAVECNFVEFPREVLQPNGVTEFGVASDKFGLKNYSGRVVYAVGRKFGDDGCGLGDFASAKKREAASFLLFTFEYVNSPPVSKHRASGVHVCDHNPGNFQISKHVESFNEGTLVFRVFDPEEPVYYQTVSATAFKACDLFKGGKPPVPCCGRIDFVSQLMKYSMAIRSKGIGITQKFCRALQAYCHLQMEQSSLPSADDETMFVTAQKKHLWGAAETSSSSEPILLIHRNYWSWTGLWGTELDSKGSRVESIQRLDSSTSSRVATPGTLVCATHLNLPNTRTILQECGIGDDFYTLLLEYKIGPEVFRSVFDPLDSLYLNTLASGGFASCEKSAQLGAVTVDRWNFLSPLLEEELSQWIRKLLCGEIGSEKFREGWLLSKRVNLPESVSFCAHRALLLFAEGFVTYLIDHCKIVSPDDWTQRFDIPEYNIWEDSEDRNRAILDAQGLNFYVSMNWTDHLSDIFPEGIALFQPLRELSARWAIQDTRSITEELVQQVVSSSIVILQRIGDMRTAAAMETLSRGLPSKDCRGASKPVYSEKLLTPLVFMPSREVSSPTTDTSTAGHNEQRQWTSPD